MKVGWLADKYPGYVGGAELTQAEFRAAAPSGVEVIDCPPGGVVAGLDRYVVHNHMHYSEYDLLAVKLAHRFRYHHDMRQQSGLEAKHIFCSPLQANNLGYPKGQRTIPPALDLSRYGATNGKREGAVWIGRYFAEKGVGLATEWAKSNGGIDFYGDGPEPPSERPYARVHGAVPYEQVPEVLARYATFVHLPREIEPFGRSVVEAWAAGCELVINGNVGARYWIEEQPEKLETAAEDFWSVVLDA